MLFALRNAETVAVKTLFTISSLRHLFCGLAATPTCAQGLLLALGVLGGEPSVVLRVKLRPAPNHCTIPPALEYSRHAQVTYKFVVDKSVLG